MPPVKGTMKAKSFDFSRVRTKSMQNHLRRVCRATAMLDDLLDETVMENDTGYCLEDHQLGELFDLVEELSEDCASLVRRARKLARDRIQDLAAPEYQQ